MRCLDFFALASYAASKGNAFRPVLTWGEQLYSGNAFRERQTMLHIKGTVVLDTMEAIKARAGKDELERIMAQLDQETKEIFQRPISPSSWYSCDAFARFLEADIRETASGNEAELIKRSEAVIEKQLRGIYKMFVRIGSPEFVIRRIAAVHATYFDGVQIIPEMKGPKSATIQYVGFSRNHRIMGFAIIGFFKRALEISGAKKVDVHFTVPIEAGEKFCELALLWD